MTPEAHHGERVILSQYAIFKQLLLDVLNFKAANFNESHVAGGIKEFYKRFQRKTEVSMQHDDI